MVIEWLQEQTDYTTYTVEGKTVTVTLTDWVYISTWYKEFTSEFGLERVYEHLLEKFDPKQTYSLRVGEYTLIIKLKDEPQKAVYDRVYNHVSPGLSGAYSVEYYSWIVHHTTVVNQGGNYYLLGDREFNQVVLSISIEDIYEVQKLFPRMILDGFTIRLPYIEDMTSVMDDLGWNINNKYYVLGSHGYYLPFDLELELAEVVEWVLDISRRYGRHITHNINGKHVDVNVHGRDDFLWLAEQFRKDLGNSSFLMQLIGHFRVGAYYTVKHKDYTVRFRHWWTRRNIRYAELVQDLINVYDFSLVTGIKNKVLLYYRVLKDSQYDSLTDSLKLKGYLYGELGILEDDVAGSLSEIRVDIYQETPGSYGEPLPMIYSYAGINIQTPYKIIRDGVYRLDYYPVALPPHYATPPIQEAYINAYIMGEERRKLEGYTDSDDLIITTQISQPKSISKVSDSFSVELPEVSKDFTLKTDDSVYKQVEQIPYISSIIQFGDSWTVTYIGGEQLTITLSGGQTEEQNALDLYGAAVFKQESLELSETQHEVINILQAVFNGTTFKPIQYQPDEGYQEEWANYLTNLVKLSLQVQQTQQYSDVQALEQIIKQYPDYELLAQLQESQGSLNDLMEMFSDDSSEVRIDQESKLPKQTISDEELAEFEAMLGLNNSVEDEQEVIPTIATTDEEDTVDSDIITDYKDADTSTGVVDIGSMFDF